MTATLGTTWFPCRAGSGLREPRQWDMGAIFQLFVKRIFSKGIIFPRCGIYSVAQHKVFLMF